MKKTFFLTVFLTLLFLSACTNESSNGKTQSLEAFYKDAKIENVDQVIIRDGSTGASKKIINQEEIIELLSRVKEIIFTPQENQEDRIGWLYEITLFDGEKEFKFSLHHIDNTYYDTSPDIYPIVDNYYKKLDTGEE